MVQIQQPFTFDRNKFLAEILSGKMYPSAVDRIINALINPNNRDKDGNVYGYYGPTTDEELKNHLKKDTEDEMIVRSFYELYKNPNGQVASDLKNLWNFVGPVLNTEKRKPTKQEYLMVLNRLNIFDEDVQLNLLRWIYNNYFRHNYSGLSDNDYKELYKTVLKMLAANPQVSIEDKSEVAHNLSDINIARDVVEQAKEELNKELNNPDKPIPDRSKLSAICGAAQHAVSGFGNDNDYRKTIMAEFDLDKILALDPQYVPKMQTSLEEQNTKLTEELRIEKYNNSHAVNDRDIEIKRLKQDLQFAQDDLDKQKVKNEQLTRQLNELEAVLRDMQSMMKTIKMKTAAIATEGMFGRGKKIKELNDYIK